MRQEVDQFGKVTRMSFAAMSVILDQGRCNPNILGEGKGEGGIKTSDCESLIDPASRDLQEQYLHELFAPGYYVSDARMVKLKSEGHQRIIWPLYSLALTAIALGVFMQKSYSRQGNTVILVKTAMIMIVVVAIHFALHNAASKREMMNIFCYINIAACFIASYFLLADRWEAQKKKWLWFLN